MNEKLDMATKYKNQGWGWSNCLILFILVIWQARGCLVDNFIGAGCKMTDFTLFYVFGDEVFASL